MIVEITLLVAAGLGNLAWDLTGRRLSARSRRRARRSKRRASLPLPAADEGAADPFARISAEAPSEFVEFTRTTAEELDRVVDHFDLVLLRAEAGESLVGDVVYVGAEAPRLRGSELVERWLAAVSQLPSELAERLRQRGLPDRDLDSLLERERERARWPNAGTSSNLLEGTASDLERAVMLLVSFLRGLTVAPSSPYR